LLSLVIVTTNVCAEGNSDNCPVEKHF